MNAQTYLDPLRAHLATTLGVASLSELGHGTIAGSAAYAYALGAASADYGTPAVLDVTWSLPVTLYAALAEGTGETAAILRDTLADMADAACDRAEWDTGLTGLVRCEVTRGPSVGDDDLSGWLAARGGNWLSGSVEVTLTIILGGGA